ncbi:MAG: PA14 domain-containing protein, partial [Planctomycetota bacterium]
TRTCTCSYQNQTSLAMVHMPEVETWTFNPIKSGQGDIRRVGINFGAPGDRATEDGTLWLDWPSVGGPSPLVPVSIKPDDARPFYRHALWIDGGQAWPWVAGSGLLGVRSMRIEPVALRSMPPDAAFGVRWAGLLVPESTETYTLFARSDHGVRLWIDGKLLLDNEAELRRGRHGEISATVPFQAGRKYRVLLEYYGSKDRKPDQAAVAELAWSSPSVPKSAIPPERLFTPEGRPGGLTAAYYDDPGLAGPAALRTDPQIRFHWAPGTRPDALRRLDRPIRLPERMFTVQLCFAEPEDLRPGQRVFSVKLQGAEVLRDLDVVKEAGVPRRGIVREFPGIRVKDALEIDLAPSTDKPPVICGVRLVAE